MIPRDRTLKITEAKYGFLWVTLLLLLISLAGHWVFAWMAYVDEQQQFNHPVRVSEYLVMTCRDMFENWQSEFLQLIWQVSGLTLLWYVGSPQSRESSDRLEEKVDYILKMIDSEKGPKEVKKLDTKYPKK